MKSSSSGRLALLVLLSAFLCSLALSTSPVQAQAPAAKATTISLANTAFDPNITIVLVNTSVVWVNKDSVNHDVTAGDQSFQSDGGSGGLTPGKQYNRTFDKPGVYDYYCTVHSPGVGQKMWGRIVVTKPPLIMPAGAAGVLPQKIGVNWLAHWVGVVSFVTVIVVLIIYYFVLKFGETVHATDHRDRKEK